MGPIITLCHRQQGRTQDLSSRKDSSPRGPWVEEVGQLHLSRVPGGGHFQPGASLRPPAWALTHGLHPHSLFQCQPQGGFLSHGPHEDLCNVTKKESTVLSNESKRHSYQHTVSSQCKLRDRDKDRERKGGTPGRQQNVNNGQGPGHGGRAEETARTL